MSGGDVLGTRSKLCQDIEQALAEKRQAELAGDPQAELEADHRLNRLLDKLPRKGS